MTKGEQTRERIVEVATQLFVTQGYHATTTRQITDQLNMARGAIYVHFESKYDIFLAALEAYHPWKQIPSVVESAEGETLDEFVHDAADRLLIVWKKRPEMIRLHLIELIEFQGRHISELFEEIFQEVTGRIREIKSKRPEFASIPTATFSRAILGLFFAYLMTDPFTGGPLRTGFDDNMYDYFADAYLQGILQNGNDKNPKKGERK
jgi:AcrR family transcriptional regulator